MNAQIAVLRASSLQREMMRCRENRNHMIVTALNAGATGPEIAKALGLTKGRIYQISKEATTSEPGHVASEVADIGNAG